MKFQIFSSFQGHPLWAAFLVCFLPAPVLEFEQKEGETMSNVISFPNIPPNRKMALYTHNHIYSGTATERQEFPGNTGIWLENVTVCPIAGQVSAEQILHLDNVCVMWQQVVAIGFPPEFSPEEPQ